VRNSAIRAIGICAVLGMLIVATATSASAQGHRGGGYHGGIGVGIRGGYHGGIGGGYHAGVSGGSPSGVNGSYHGGVGGAYYGGHYHGDIVGGGGIIGRYATGTGRHALADHLFGDAGFRRYAFRHGRWWAGPVFLPFLFGDIFAFALWPYDYYNPFWTLGDNFALATIFAPGAYFFPGYVASLYGGLPNIYYYGAEGDELVQANAIALQSCGALAPDVSSLPARIRQIVRPTAEQEMALDDLISASSKAKEIIVGSCPKEIPLTPPSRLDVAEKRLEAMIQAVEIIRPPLQKFYDSLTDEQKQHLEAKGSAGAEIGNLAMLCGPRSGNVANLPEQRIEQALQPNTQQQGLFDELKKASESATKDLQASCPVQTPQTPVARLDAVEARLSAMVEALKTVRPKLEDFYASLNDEQKARFNILPTPHQLAPQPEH
jgi:LTXXQ motif family protein